MQPEEIIWNSLSSINLFEFCGWVFCSIKWYEKNCVVTWYGPPDIPRWVSGRQGWPQVTEACCYHYVDAIMSAMASQITSLTIVYSTVHSSAERKHQSSASLAYVKGIHRWPMNSQHKGPVKRKMFPCDDVIMISDFRDQVHTNFTCGKVVVQRVAELRSLVKYERVSA